MSPRISGSASCPNGSGLSTGGRLNAEVRRSLAEYGFEDVLPMNLLGDQLSSAQRQVVEIMRALKSGVRVLALDEPTSSLTDDEVERLFTLVRRLRDEGVAIIYVSHRIKEILQLCDRVAILRDGRLIAVKPAADLTDAEIVRLMVGRDLTDVFQRRPAGTDREVLRVEDIRSNWHRGVSFYINAGEVVGFAGLVGAGRTELAKVIFGELPKNSGHIVLDGRDVTIRRPDDAIDKGIGFAPEDRKREGLILIRSVLENASLAILRRLSRFHFVRSGLERSVVTGFVEQAARAHAVDRPGSRQTFRRQPAEGRAGALAGGQAEGADPGRADARHRRRRQGRDLPADRRSRQRRAGHHVYQLRIAGIARAGRSYLCHAKRPDHRRTRRARVPPRKPCSRWRWPTTLSAVPGGTAPQPQKDSAQ